MNKGRAGKGYPRKFTRATRKAILEGVASGLFPSTAAGLAGVSASALSQWLTQGRDHPETYPDKAKFVLDMEQAEAVAESGMFDKIKEAADEEKDWKAAAWLLERRKPERWGRANKVEVSGPDGERLVPRELLEIAMERARVIADRRRKKKSEGSDPPTSEE